MNFSILVCTVSSSSGLLALLLTSYRYYVLVSHCQNGDEAWIIFSSLCSVKSSKSRKKFCNVNKWNLRFCFDEFDESRNFSTINSFENKVVWKIEDMVKPSFFIKSINYLDVLWAFSDRGVGGGVWCKVKSFLSLKG